MDLLGKIAYLYDTRGAARYESGRADSVSQVEHALQCAKLAEDHGAGPALVTACLLHDLGHLLYADGEFAVGSDDEHETRAIPLLGRAFGPDVTEPVRLHVDAKRYLCSVDAAYYDGLSASSKSSLAAQGGPFDAVAAQAFLTRPHAREAILLRSWDDLAKDKGLATRSMAYYLRIAQAAMRETSTSA